jgi:hypothetical protein
MKTAQVFHYQKVRIVGWVIMLVLMAFILLKITAPYF